MSLIRAKQLSVETGNIIVGNGTDNGSLLAPGSNGTVLLSNGTTVSYSFVEDLRGSTGLNIIDGVSVASAVNYLEASNAITGSAPSIVAAGTDTNIDLLLQAKGTGYVRANTGYTLTGSAPDEAFATKGYVDSLSQGLDPKGSVVAKSTGTNVTLSGTTTLDGVSVVAGNRVLLTDQTNPIENGVWVVQAGAWTRPTDFDSTVTSTSGSFVFVEEGTLYADTGWVLSTDNDPVVDTDANAWVQFSSAGLVLAGVGLTKTGNTIDINVGASTINVNGSDDLIVNSNANANQFLRSAGTVGTEATYSYVSDLRDATNGLLAIEGTAQASSVNFLRVLSTAAASSPVLSAQGTDTNINLILDPKGTGLVRVADAATYDAELANPGNTDALVTKQYVTDQIGALSTSRIQDTATTTFVDTELTTGRVIIGSQNETVAEFTSTASQDTYLVVNSGVAGEIRLEAEGATNGDIRLVPNGSGQVIIGETGDGIIESDSNQNMTVRSGASATGNSGNLVLEGGDATAGNGGNVIIRGGDGSGTDGIVEVQDASNNRVVTFEGVASAVNYMTVVNAAAGGDVRLNAVGTDTNIDILLDPKGTGLVRVADAATYDAELANPGNDDALVTKAYVNTLTAGSTPGTDEVLATGVANESFTGFFTNTPSSNDNIVVYFNGVKLRATGWTRTGNNLTLVDSVNGYATDAGDVISATYNY